MEIMEKQIEKLTREIEAYKQAIQTAQNALAAAKHELDEALSIWAEENRPTYNG